METDGGVASGRLDQVIEELRSLSGDIESCGVLSPEGELLCCSHRSGVDRERVSAMLAALARLVRDAARRNGKERPSQVRIRTELGYVLMVGLENGGMLVATASPEARAGLALYDMRNVRGEVEQAMEGRRR